MKIDGTHDYLVDVINNCKMIMDSEKKLPYTKGINFLGVEKIVVFRFWRSHFFINENFAKKHIFL
jgi:hypothetical protein